MPKHVRPDLFLVPSTKLSCPAGQDENSNETEGSEGTNSPHNGPSLWDKLTFRRHAKPTSQRDVHAHALEIRGR